MGGCAVNVMCCLQLKHSKLAHPDDAALLALRKGSKLAGLVAAERYMVAKQLEQHYCTNGAATGAVHDAKVTGVWMYDTAIMYAQEAGSQLWASLTGFLLVHHHICCTEVIVCVPLHQE